MLYLFNVTDKCNSVNEIFDANRCMKWGFVSCPVCGDEFLN